MRLPAKIKCYAFTTGHADINQLRAAPEAHARAPHLAHEGELPKRVHERRSAPVYRVLRHQLTLARVAMLFLAA